MHLALVQDLALVQAKTECDLGSLFKNAEASAQLYIYKCIYINIFCSCTDISIYIWTLYVLIYISQLSTGTDRTRFGISVNECWGFCSAMYIPYWHRRLRPPDISGARTSLDLPDTAHVPPLTLGQHTSHIVPHTDHSTHIWAWQWHQLRATDACAQHQPHDSPLSSAREVQQPRHLQAQQRHTRTTPHTFEREAVASASAARDPRLRAASASRRATSFWSRRAAASSAGAAAASAARDCRACRRHGGRTSRAEEGGESRGWCCAQARQRHQLHATDACAGISCTRPTLARCLSIAPRRLLRLRRAHSGPVLRIRPPPLW